MQAQNSLRGTALSGLLRLNEDALIAMISKLCPNLPQIIPYLIVDEIVKSRR